MTVALKCIAVMSLMVFGLGINVSRIRRKQLKGVRPPEEELQAAIRAHGNLTEYAPILGLIMFAIHYKLGNNVPTWVNGMMVAAVVSRVSHVVGMLGFSHVKASLPRLIGAVGTYYTGITLSTYLLLQTLRE